jgi:threonyl-tRNA synthetase
VDDSDETLSRKVARANMEWIPYVAVIGDKEAESGLFSVTVRETGRRVNMSRDELAQEIRMRCAGKPYRPLALPKLLSQRPIFK